MTATDTFGDRLRLWRARRGISQLDLAVKALTTQRHISFLEAGRSKPGPDIVHRIASVLELAARERNELLLAAGLAPAIPEMPLTELGPGSVLSSLQDLLHSFSPSPAILTRPPGDIVADNSAMSVFYDLVDPQLLRGPINVYRLALHPLGLRPHIENFSSWAAHVTSALHERSNRYLDGAYFQLAHELEEYVPAEILTGALAGVLAPMRLRTRLGIIELITGRMTLGNAASVTLSELELEVFLPADSPSRDALAHLAETAKDGSTRPN